MTHPYVTNQKSTKTFHERFFSALYAYYYIHMGVLYIIGSYPKLAQSLSEMLWLFTALLILNIVTFVYTFYRIIKNKRMADECMQKMPNWMYRWMERMPDWMLRWMNHKFMRVMMITMDVMVIWMCVEFVRYAYTQLS